MSTCLSMLVGWYQAGLEIRMKLILSHLTRLFSLPPRNRMLSDNALAAPGVFICVRIMLAALVLLRHSKLLLVNLEVSSWYLQASPMPPAPLLWLVFFLFCFSVSLQKFVLVRSYLDAVAMSSFFYNSW